ncbi:MAG: phosphopeptide-binding protein [Piscirickettsiaceae bacterium]|nr:MAG: phosphopeptide-binding protein [Piscirickettsiaceae bacterium]
MAKFTLHFKNKIVRVFHLNEEDSTIGRDPSNTFSIDSLAVAPTHLAISYEGKQFYVENVSEQLPSFLNGKPVDKQPLTNGDRIHLGKHELLFTDDVIDYGNLPQNKNVTNDEEKPAKKQTLLTANLQILNGADIGRVISLNSALTEIKNDGQVPAIIAKRQSGYFVSKLIDDVEICIDNELTDNEAKLEDNTKLRIGNQKFVFFFE